MAALAENIVRTAEPAMCRFWIKTGRGRPCTGAEQGSALLDNNSGDNDEAVIPPTGD
jgi:hypothetical protein